MAIKKYHEAVKTMEDLFTTFNDHLFDGEITTPVITISPDPSRKSYGWCTTQKIWKSEDEEYYEINICAEYLNRPLKELCGTLIHEMVHLHNIHNGIQDTSANGRYHNKKFKETAEARGLVIEKQGNIGWSKTSLSEELAALEKALEMDKERFIRIKKDEIIPFIEEEIATRYWFQEAGVKIRLRYDKQLKKALKR